MASCSKIIGYARVSINDQSLDAQHDALAEVGAVRVFSETMSGAKAKRPELDKMLDQFGSFAKTFWGKLGLLFVLYYTAFKRSSSVFTISAMTQFPRSKARSTIRISLCI